MKNKLFISIVDTMPIFTLPILLIMSKEEIKYNFLYTKERTTKTNNRDRLFIYLLIYH